MNKVEAQVRKFLKNTKIYRADSKIIISESFVENNKTKYLEHIVE